MERRILLSLQPRYAALTFLRVSLLSLGCLYGATHAHATQTDPQFATYLAQWLAMPSLRFGTTDIDTAQARSFYAAENYQPLWVDANGLTPRAKQAIALMEKADTEGLNPDLYAIRTIQNIAQMPATDAEHATRIRLSLELLTSNAIMHYGADMYTGAARHQWNTGENSASAHMQVSLLQQASRTNNTAGYLASLAPQTRGYTALKSMLARYQGIASNGGWPHFTPGKTIKPGMSDPRVATLRQILVVNDDLPASSAASTTPALYDPATVTAVKRFQTRHSIEPDGVIGTATQTALSVPVSARIEQIAMTLERMRWMPHDMGSRYVLVNVPGYTLTAISGTQRMDMKVIVGKPSTKTPMFSNEITAVILNPSWGVPQKIALNEMLPKIRKNPSYLTNAGYKVVENGTEVDPTSIDWEAVGHGNFGYSIRQEPGDGNALGKVKFNIPDSDNIYLHDTSQRGLFAQSERSLSHGCIRLADPKALTEFVLEGEGWSTAKIDAAYESATSRTVSVTPLPVHLVYWTTWVDDQGLEHFQRDIYGMDKTLLASMGSPTPRDTDIKLAMNN